MKESRSIGAGLALMSFSSGCIDILSYRFLGQVFTSAMTGNVALMGLDLGQGALGAASRNMTAFAGFIAGVAVGAVIMRPAAERGRLLAATLLEAALLIGFAAAWRFRGVEATVYALIAVSAVAMGIQSAVAHRIGKPGISTTYFTGTITGIVFNLVGAQPSFTRAAWPLLALIAYIGGAAAAGWYSAGHSGPDLPMVLPLLPALAALTLAVLIALARK